MRQGISRECAAFEPAEHVLLLNARLFNQQFADAGRQHLVVGLGASYQCSPWPHSAGGRTRCRLVFAVMSHWKHVRAIHRPARRVLVLAQEEARLLDHSFIGTEHLLYPQSEEGT